VYRSRGRQKDDNQYFHRKGGKREERQSQPQLEKRGVVGKEGQEVGHLHFRCKAGRSEIAILHRTVMMKGREVKYKPKK